MPHYGAVAIEDAMVTYLVRRWSRSESASFGVKTLAALEATFPEYCRLANCRLFRGTKL